MLKRQQPQARLDRLLGNDNLPAKVGRLSTDWEEVHRSLRGTRRK